MKPDTKAAVAAADEFLGSLDEMLLGIRVDNAITTTAPGFRCRGTYIPMGPRCGCQVGKIETIDLFSTSAEAQMVPIHPQDLEALWYQYRIIGDHKPFASGLMSGMGQMFASQILAMNSIDADSEDITEDLAEYAGWYWRRVEFWESITNPLPTEEELLNA